MWLNIKNSFFVNEIIIDWGKTLAEVDALLEFVGRSYSEYRGKKRSVQCACANIFDFPAVSAECHAPSYEKPVTQVFFDLAPPDIAKQNNHEIWSLPLSEQFGIPENVSKSSNYGSGSVIHNFQWNHFPVQLGLSVFGGVRKGIPYPVMIWSFLNV